MKMNIKQIANIIREHMPELDEDPEWITELEGNQELYELDIWAGHRSVACYAYEDGDGCSVMFHALDNAAIKASPDNDSIMTKEDAVAVAQWLYGGRDKDVLEAELMDGGDVYRYAELCLKSGLWADREYIADTVCDL